LSERRNVRDPIFGFIPIDTTEAEIIATPVFQRLRWIRQLAFANLVYPGALHTRFEHSLGVYFLASQMGKALSFNEDDCRLARLAALLHDLGHGPFSHVSEQLLEFYADEAKLSKRLKGKDKETIHELITEDMINLDDHLTNVISNTERQRVVSLLREGYGEPVMKSLVSGPIDADKQDYLLRDSYFCGVKYGVFDIQQLHRELRVKTDPADNSKQLMITEDGVHALEQFMLAKYYLTTQVYQHRVRLITDQMLIRAVRLGIDKDEIGGLRSLYSYDGTPEFAQKYKQWNDIRFLTTFTGEEYEGKLCGKLLARLLQRKLLKRVYVKKLSQLSPEIRDPLSRISEPDESERRSLLEQRVYEQISRVVRDESKARMDETDSADFLIIHSYSIKSVRTQSGTDEAAILVDCRGGPKYFEDESRLFNSINTELSEKLVEVYAPVWYDSPAERDVLLKSLDEPISREMESFFKEEKDDAHS